MSGKESQETYLIMFCPSTLSDITSNIIADRQVLGLKISIRLIYINEILQLD
jgi:hypothetical protein